MQIYQVNSIGAYLYKGIRHLIQNRRTSKTWFFLEALFVYIISACYFLHVMLPLEASITVDGLFHYRISEVLWEERKLWYSIHWLPFTILGNEGPDHHWFWHILIAPLTQLSSDSFTGFKIASALSGALVPAAFSLVSRLLGIPFAPLIALLAAFSDYILPGRYLMLKAQNLAIIIIFCCAWAMLNGRYVILFILSAVFMYSYHGAILLAPIGVFAVLVNYLYSKNFSLLIPIVIATGLLFALIINPWYPESVNYLTFHIFYKMLTETNILPGNEWFRLSPTQFFMNSIVAHCLLLFSAALATWRCFKSGKKPSKEAVLFLFISVMMFIMYLSARRFAEYYAPAAVFTAALFLKDSIKADSHKILISLSLLSLILFSAIRNSEVVPEAAKLNPNKYQTVFDYLSNFARQDDVVFNPGWADFPFFIWQSYDYRYINGLDPHYLAYGDWNRFTRWWAFYNDSPATLEDPVSVIRNEFNADWIALDGTYPNLLMFLLQSERVQLVVADEQQFLFKVLPERGNSDQ